MGLRKINALNILFSFHSMWLNQDIISICDTSLHPKLELAKWSRWPPHLVWVFSSLGHDYGLAVRLILVVRIHSSEVQN